MEGQRILAFTRAFPAMVAPMNSQKGIRKCPQQMPHRSNSAFGQAASRKMPQKPCLLQQTSNQPFEPLPYLTSACLCHSPYRLHMPHLALAFFGLM